MWEEGAGGYSLKGTGTEDTFCLLIFLVQLSAKRIPASKKRLNSDYNLLL